MVSRKADTYEHNLTFGSLSIQNKQKLKDNEASNQDHPKKKETTYQHTEVKKHITKREPKIVNSKSKLEA